MLWVQATQRGEILMDLRQLQYFMAAVEQRSLGRAAEALNISQPAISKAIRRLEKRLGIDLLERLPRGVSPTEYGRALALRGHIIQRELQRAEDELAAMKNGEAGRVSIGAGASMRIRLVPEAIQKLVSNNPDVEIDMIGELRDRLIPDLKEGKIDIVVSQVSDASDDPELQVTPIYCDQTRPTVRVDHPLLRRDTLTAADCLEYGWILPAKDHFGRRQLEAYFFALNLPAPKTAIENSSAVFAISMVRQSNLISWHPDQVIESANGGDVIALDIPEITFRRTIGISVRRDSVVTPPAQLLIDALHSVARNMIAEGVVEALSTSHP